MKSGTNQLSYNARSIFPKLNYLTAVCCELHPDIVCIVESWLSGDISDDEITLSDYSVVRLDKNRHGGGVSIYIRSSLSFYATVSGPFDLIIIFVTIHLSDNKTVFLDTFYRQPSSPSSIFGVLFEVLHVFFQCNMFLALYSTWIFFNVDVLSSSPLCNHLNNILQSFSLTQVVTEPTHIKHNGDSSLIDLVLMSAPETLSICTTVPPLANSDHLGIYIEYIVSVTEYNRNEGSFGGTTMLISPWPVHCSMSLIFQFY